MPLINQIRGHMPPSKSAPDEIRKNMFLPQMKKSSMNMNFPIFRTIVGHYDLYFHYYLIKLFVHFITNGLKQINKNKCLKFR